MIIHFNHLKFCPFLPPFVFAVLSQPSFNVPSSVFFVSIDLDASIKLLNLATLRDTTPLKQIETIIIINKIK